jgi:plastocyanin
MPEFNDRRPRTKMRVATKNIQPGDKLEHTSTPGVLHDVAGVTRGLMETGNGVTSGHTVTMSSGGAFTVNSNMKHTVHRLDSEPDNDGGMPNERSERAQVVRERQASMVIQPPSTRAPRRA